MNAIDWGIIKRTRDGDESSFTALMTRYKRPIMDFIYRMIGDAGDSEDMAQAVFIKTYNAIMRGYFRPDKGELSTWLFTVARNVACDRLRHCRRRPLSLAGDIVDFDIANVPGHAKDDIVTHDIGRQISEAIAALPQDQRTAIILAEYEGLSHTQIAAVMKCSVKSVESRLYRARCFLRVRLAPHLQ